MCGIAGFARSGRAEPELERLLDGLHHRGPDDRGTWSGAHWRLGMARLSIMDLQRGHQPMRSSDGRWTLILNGEIYNFRELRKRMEGQGHHFQTTSDTEVLLELIAAIGVPRACEQIEGMFAFAAVDEGAGDLWLARDRFGEKPLFLDRRDGDFRFCSELAPLLQAGGS